MVDFFMIATKQPKMNEVVIYPKFIVRKSKDLMVRGGAFYGVWLEDAGMWSTDEEDVYKLIDHELDKYREEHNGEYAYCSKVSVLHVWDAESGIIDRWIKYVTKQLPECYEPLDERLIFSNQVVKKEDYASKKLPYPLVEGECPTWDKIIGTLYTEEERHKIEWVIGAIVSGDSRNLQKFLVLYGSAGTGKSTIINIMQDLFEGYWSPFDSKALGQSNSTFALEPFKKNPLVAIEHDGDLSRIEDNTRLNSLVSHETMTVNNKFEKLYDTRFKSFLIMGTNKPVKITDAKSGILRRLIDVTPSGNTIPKTEYLQLMEKVKFELGAIAHRCLQVYSYNPRFYDSYVPLKMMGVTNDFYNFVLDSYFAFEKENAVTLKSAWEMYKVWCDEAKIQYPMNMRTFKTELMNYFEEFKERDTVGEHRPRNLYIGFKKDIFSKHVVEDDDEIEPPINVIDFKVQPSIFDEIFADQPAQYANDQGTPTTSWDLCTTKLRDLDTSKEHYVLLPDDLIVEDFDLKDESGAKSYIRNLEAANAFPPTYAELSKSGAGIHLHYWWKGGNVDDLSGVYAENIETKKFTGKSALRRKLTKCNNLGIADIASGLPLKGVKQVVNFDSVKSEKGLRTLIIRNLGKEYHPGTKPSIDFIKKILDDAYESGLHYDVSDMEPDVFMFAANSTNQSEYCIRVVNDMKFKSKDCVGDKLDDYSCEEGGLADRPIVIFDCEVAPNHFLICWCLEDEDSDIVAMLDPTPIEIEEFIKYRLVGYNNAGYDDHIVYARLLGYSNEALHQLNKNIIASKRGDNTYKFREAKSIGYTDIMDYYGDKYKSLKDWEIELHLPHKEWEHDWDEPIPDELLDKWIDYCKADVRATRAVWHATQDKFKARLILAELAGGTPMDSTNSLTTKIITKGRRPVPFVYTDLHTGISTDGTFKENNKFERYEFIDGKNIYHADDGDIDVGFGGWNYGKPGVYRRVKTFDISQEHPSSAYEMRIFGDMSDNFKEMIDLSVILKHKDFEAASKMMGGKLMKYLDNPAGVKELRSAIKLANNSVYGLTSAKFPNALRDDRNVNNIVALRGALFMITLKAEIEKRGFTVISCKTDSCKVVDPTPELEEFIFEFGKFYGYSFEIENIFEKICLINVSTFIALCAEDDPDPDMRGKWYAKAERFAVPYVFKTLFSHEPLEFYDFCEKFRAMKGTIYIDMNEGLPDVTKEEKELDKLKSKFARGEISDTTFEKEATILNDKITTGHNYIFVGKVGQFTPIKEGCGGGVLYAKRDGKYSAIGGTKGYRWLESDVVKDLEKEGDIDIGYYETLCDKAKAEIEKYGSYERFVSDEVYLPEQDVEDDFMNIPEDAPDPMPFG